MDIMFIVFVIILIFTIFTYDIWSYKAWCERCIKKGTGYDFDGNYYDHNKGLVYYKDGSAEKIDYKNLNKNRQRRKIMNNDKNNSNKNEFPINLQPDPSESVFRFW